MWSQFRMDKNNARLEFSKLFMNIESYGVSTLTIWGHKSLKVV